MHSPAVLTAVTWAAKGFLPACSWSSALRRSPDSLAALSVRVGGVGIVHHLGRDEKRQLRSGQIVEHPRPTTQPNHFVVVQLPQCIMKRADRQTGMPLSQMAPQHVKLATDGLLPGPVVDECHD